MELQGCTARHSLARLSTARHGSAQLGTARHGSARLGTARHGSEQLSMAHKSSAWLSTARHAPQGAVLSQGAGKRRASSCSTALEPSLPPEEERRAMGSRLSLDDSVRVVIVGGGFGGTAAASQLKAWAVPFVLVDMRDAFHHNVAALRASVESGFARKTFISYSATFGDSFRQGRVVGIDPARQQVLLSDGEELHYSHLILATGSDGPFPGKFNKVIDMENAIQAYEDMVKEIEKAERILVVGGGAAGVEMAAEIKTEHPAKEVTLIHSKIALADAELLHSVRQEVKEILLRKGVRLLLGERVSNVENLTTNQFQKDMVVRTEKGTEVAADMVVLCTGIKINSSAYASAFGEQLASNGALRVNEHLQLEGHENIYAVGDCADLREPKMAYHAGLHANVVVTNIINSLTHKPLKTYQPGSLTFLLSMGKNDGVGQVNGYYVGRLLVTIAKSRDLFVSKSWKTMGQTMPS